MTNIEKHIIREDGEEMFSAMKRRIDDLRRTGANATSRVLECESVIAEVAGHEIGPDGREVRGSSDLLSQPGAETVLIDACRELAYSMKDLTDPKERLEAKGYLDIGQTAQARIVQKQTGEEIDIEQWRKEKNYQFDAGRNSLTGETFENIQLYPTDKIPVRPTMQQMEQMRIDTKNEVVANRTDHELMIIQEAKERSPYADKPYDPETEWLSDIMYIVSKELHLDTLSRDEQKKALIVVPCVGQRADVILGLDCFFEYRDPETGTVVHATLDLTLNTEKKLTEGWKADIVVTPGASYVHPSMNIDVAYENPEIKMIDATMRNQRRELIGKAIAAIIRKKLTSAKKGSPIDFRFKEEMKGGPHRKSLRERFGFSRPRQNHG
jgi:hypothetical protein